MPEHPGGGELIEEHLGKNIEEQFEEAEHTKHALKLLKALPQIGVIGASLASNSVKKELEEELKQKPPLQYEKCE